MIDEKTSLLVLNNSDTLSCKFSKHFKLKKEEIEYIISKVKDMTKKKYPNIDVKTETLNDNTSGFKIHISNCNDEIINQVRKYIDDMRIKSNLSHKHLFKL